MQLLFFRLKFQHMRSPLGVLWSRSAISWGAPLPPFPFPFLRSACSGPLQGSSSFKLETSQVWQTEASNHTIGKARACRAERRGSKPATDFRGHKNVATSSLGNVLGSLRGKKDGDSHWACDCPTSVACGVLPSSPSMENAFQDGAEQTDSSKNR